ncbi:hypothetical protein ABPG77_004712 [Micractinium sp. CCAP 211/92]
MTTVLGRLVGGGPPGDQQGQDGKLLELADTRDEQEAAVAGTKHVQEEAMSPATDDAALASVITQVSRDQQTAPLPPAVQYAEQPGDEGSEVRSNWKNKFRSIFCCLAPSANAQYVRQEECPVVIRPIAPQPPGWTEPVLGPQLPQDVGKKCLVLDLDETLVHSSFKPVPQPDYIIPVEIEGRIVDVYVLKRPFVDHFLRAVGSRFEVVVFTASLGKYADPLLDLLDKANVVRWRLFREACYPYEGSYVKDLQCLGRDLGQTIIVDNSPHSYMFQPENALPIGTFIDDMQDQVCVCVGGGGGALRGCMLKRVGGGRRTFRVLGGNLSRETTCRTGTDGGAAWRRAKQQAKCRQAGMRGPRRGQRALLVAALLWVPPASLHPACLRPTHAHARTPLQELLDCLDLLLAVEKVEDVRAHLGPILARKQAGLLASFTQAVGNLGNMLSGGRATPSDTS